ncbi:MAG TPA: (deoxy)nucleoside triphosphate pyrophosphohydrolase [Steroidobacteraceae bacterium]|nr:(deoxy)nucleoside triphosphate pyrophosphohydrolase [Steroidobacteraceae bacterium]
MPRVALRVVAAALARPAAGGIEILIAQRPAGKWQAGRWEFPGGKIEPGETGAGALARELLEELGVTVHDARSMGVFPHDYPDRSVDIALWLVTGFGGDPQGLDGQALLWIPVEDLGDHDLLEADLPMLAPLREALRAG